jgi:hypothetical protein
MEIEAIQTHVNLQRENDHGELAPSRQLGGEFGYSAVLLLS